MKKPVIEFKDFSFKYMAQAEPTLNNINLTIYEGEKVLIIGPSGSGKSTISNAINGLVPFKYEGEITGSLKVNGKETKDLSIFELSKMVGTVLQDTDGQFIGLTCGEDIAFKLENNLKSQEYMKRRVKEVAGMVGIENYIDHSPQKLSGGQKQRVSLGGAIVDDCNILLFDEPLANLDPASGMEAIELIDEIQSHNNKTVLIIEHRLEEVLHKNVDRIIVVSEGKIIGDGSPDQILSSDLLDKCGIREPLYLSALKYAGCSINDKKDLWNVNKIDVEPFKDKLKDFYSAAEQDEKAEKEEPILELENIDFRYDNKRQILNHVSFKINKGEMVSIIGKNGAGKSTISKLICGFYKSDNGRILFDGKDISNESIKDRAEKIGMVMQNPNQMISKNMIYDEVALGLRIRKYSEEEIKERVYHALKICGLYGHRNWPICALSFGQKKRVTIASILVLDPKVIILDEPTAGQDLKHYKEIMDFLCTLNKQGITIIIITHDMHLMLEYTRRAVVLCDGKVLKDGDTYDVLNDEDAIKKANLKETSLYRLSLRAGIQSPKSLVEKFIKAERGQL